MKWTRRFRTAGTDASVSQAEVSARIDSPQRPDFSPEDQQGPRPRARRDALPDRRQLRIEISGHHVRLGDVPDPRAELPDGPAHVGQAGMAIAVGTNPGAAQ